MKYFLLIILLFTISCSNTQNTGMYDKNNKVSSGSAISKNVFTDISQFSDKIVKVKIRNTSGDFDIDKTKLKKKIKFGKNNTNFWWKF